MADVALGARFPARWAATGSPTRTSTPYCKPFTDRRAGEPRGLQGRGDRHRESQLALRFARDAVATLPSADPRTSCSIAAAADKFYGSRKKRTWWYSLFHGTFPVHRGGGTKQLEYPMSLLQARLVDPHLPGGRAVEVGAVQKFKHGPAIMAMQAEVPVIPIYIEGLRERHAEGPARAAAGPVRARIGKPVWLTRRRLPCRTAPRCWRTRCANSLGCTAAPRSLRRTPRRLGGP